MSEETTGCVQEADRQVAKNFATRSWWRGSVGNVRMTEERWKQALAAFDQAADADQGDPSPDPIYHAVGRALSMWENVEDAMANIFSIATGGDAQPGMSPAKRAYGRTSSFNSRVEMVKEAADVFFMELGGDVPGMTARLNELQSDVAKAKKAATKASERRNEIAHGQAAKRTWMHDPRNPTFSDDTFYLLPAHYNPRKTTLIPRSASIGPGELPKHLVDLMEGRFGAFRYNAAQIHYYADCFMHLTQDLRNLVDHLMRIVMEAQRRKSAGAEPPASPPEPPRAA